MQVFPTRATVQVTAAAVAALAFGAALQRPELALAGGAMLVTVGAFRALAMRTVADIRAAGLEMAWLGQTRGLRVRRHGELTLRCELRNRGSAHARGVRLRVHAAPELGARLYASGSEQPLPEQVAVELPPRSRVTIEVRICPTRVGRFAVHGVALEVRGVPVGGDALFEAPLMFANPVGVEVTVGGAAREGQPRAMTGGAGTGSRRARSRRGEGDELRELRDFTHGDPLKRVAWRASARRGTLLVREMEQELPQRLTVLVDARAPGWAGAIGAAPLDFGLELAHRLAQRAYARGDTVGLRVLRDSGMLGLSPARGVNHRGQLEQILIDVAALGHDASACGVDADDVERWVAEHMRPMDGGRGEGGRAELVARAEDLRARAPFRVAAPQGSDATDARLRQHLAEFGVALPPRTTRAPHSASLRHALESALHEDRAGVQLITLADRDVVRAVESLRRLQRKRLEVWLVREPLELEASGESAFAGAVAHTVRLGVEQRHERFSSQLRALGVRVRVLAMPHPTAPAVGGSTP